LPVLLLQNARKVLVEKDSKKIGPKKGVFGVQMTSK
jgi:hypothetical protein